MLYITFTNLLLTKAMGPSEAGLPRSTIFRSGRTCKLEWRPELDRVPVQSLTDIERMNRAHEYLFYYYAIIFLSQ